MHEDTSEQINIKKGFFNRSVFRGTVNIEKLIVHYGDKNYNDFMDSFLNQNTAAQQIPHAKKRVYTKTNSKILGPEEVLNDLPKYRKRVMSE